MIEIFVCALALAMLFAGGWAVATGPERIPPCWLCADALWLCGECGLHTCYRAPPFPCPTCCPETYA